MSAPDTPGLMAFAARPDGAFDRLWFPGDPRATLRAALGVAAGFRTFYVLAREVENGPGANGLTRPLAFREDGGEILLGGWAMTLFGGARLDPETLRSPEVA